MKRWSPHRVAAGVAIVALLLALASCGDPPQVKLQRARVALAADDPAAALELAEQAAAGLPDDDGALIVVAQARLRLRQLPSSRELIDQLLERLPDDEQVRRLQAVWLFTRMQQLVTQTGFAEQTALQRQYDEAAAEVARLADWRQRAADQPAHGDYLRGRLAEAEAARARIMIDAWRQRSRSAVPLVGQIDPAEQPDSLIARFEQRIRDQRAEALQLYKAAIDADPTQFDAAGRFVELHDDPAKWEQVWSVAQAVAEQSDAPARVAEKLVLSLLEMDDKQKPAADRLALGWKLQSAVPQDEKSSAPWLLSSARLHLRNGDHDKARPVIDTLLRRSPGDTTGRLLKARMHYLAGEYAPARDILLRMTNDKRTAQSAPVYALLGMCYRKLGDLTSAADTLRRAAELDPTDQRAREAMIELRLQQRQVAGIEKHIERLYEQDPTKPRHITLMIRLELMRNNTVVIEDILAVTAELRPQTDELLRVLIDGYNRIGKAAAAEPHARELVKRSPDAVESHMLLADVLLGMGKDDDVARLVEELRQKFPDNAAADLALGRLYMRQERYDKAVELLGRFVEAQDDHADARFLLAQAYWYLAMNEDALAHARRFLEQDPSSIRGRALAAGILESLGRDDEADRELSKIDVAQLDEQRHPALLARLRMRLRQYDEAAGICMRAITAGDRDPMLHRILAEIYRRLDRPDDTVTQLESRIRHHSGDPAAWLALASFYVKRDQPQAGIVKLRQLESLNPLLSTIGQASVLADTHRYDQAVELIEPLLDSLVKSRRRLALSVADELSRIHRKVGRRDAAAAVYDRLINANLLAERATLHKLDLNWQRNDDAEKLRVLDALAAQLTPEKHAIRYEVIQRYLKMKQQDKALALVEEWLSQAPHRVELRRWRGELLTEMNRADEAVAHLRQAIVDAPQDVSLRQTLFKAHLKHRDYPEAEKTLRLLADLDAGARLAALFDLVDMYQAIGLNARALRTLEELKGAGQPNDPRIPYLTGRSLAALGRDGEAREALLLVPPYAAQYVPAQIMAVRVERRLGMTDEAEQRLKLLARTRETASAAARELLKLKVNTAGEQQLLEWSDQAIALDELPPESRQAWLGVRIGIAARRQDWPAVVESLEAMGRLDLVPDSVAVARIIVYHMLGRIDDARTLWERHTGLRKNVLGPSVALLLGEPFIERDEPRGVAPFFEMLAAGRLDDAAQYLEQLPESQSFFRGDLRAMIESDDVSSDERIRLFRRTLAVMLAIELGLPEIGLELANQLIQTRGDYVPAHALRIRALGDMNRPIRDELESLHAVGPSSLSTYLKARQAVMQGDYPGAAELLTEAADAEPASAHIRYVLAQVLLRLDRHEEAAKLLEELAFRRNRYQFSALNDLAFVLAERFPEQREKAITLAERLEPAAVISPALADTIGWIEHLRGNDERALHHLSRVVLEAGRLTAVQYHIGAVYHALGQAKWARYYLEEAARGPEGVRETELARELLAKIRSGDETGTN